jgi:hypothetical protein
MVCWLGPFPSPKEMRVQWFQNISLGLKITMNYDITIYSNWFGKICLGEGKDKSSLSLEEVGKDGRHISIYLKGTFLAFWGHF